MLRSSREGPTEEKTGRRMPIRLGTALIAATGLLLGPLALATSASAASLPHATTPVTGTYVPVSPFRITDTRTGSGLPNAGSTLTATAPTLTVQVTGLGTAPVPATASAAVLNVTATNTKSSGFFTVFPAGITMPVVSNLNFVAGQNVANLVTVPLSAAGAVSIYSSATDADVTVDVEGYYTSTPSATGYGLYNAVAPYRALGALGFGAPVAATTSVPVTVTGTATGVPANASAVVLNVTAAHDSAASFLSVYPAPAITTAPAFSNVNFAAGQAVGNRVIVPVGTGGVVEVYNHAGSADVDVDVVGYYTGVGGTGSAFTPLAAPVRVADTRTASLVGTETAIGAAKSESFSLATAASGIPATATAVAANVTAVSNTTSGYLSIYPAPAMTTQPNFSDINWVASDIVANFSIAPTNGTGSVEMYNSYGTVDVVVDVFGYFTTYVTVGPVMASAVVTATSITVTYNQAVTCVAAADAEFTYYYTGAASGGATTGAPGAVCSGTTLTLSGTFTLPVGVGTIEYIAGANVVKNSSGTAALTPQALAVGATAGLTMVSAQVNAAGVQITYNEDVSCQLAGAGGTAYTDFVYYSSTGILGGAINGCVTGAASDVLELTSAAAFQDPGTGAEIVYTEPATPIATAAAAPFGNAVYATGGPSVFAATQTLTTWESPAMVTAVVTPGAYGVGIIKVSYNENVNCPGTLAGIQAAFVYSNGGTLAYPTVCAGSGTGTLTLSDFYAGGITGTTAVTLVTPVSTDTLVYTEPATDAAGVSVGVTAVIFPEWAATQTLPYSGLTGIPAMVSATVTATTIAITYNESVFCGATTDLAFAYDYTLGVSGGAITAGSCTTSGDVLTMTGAFNTPLGSAEIIYTAPGATGVYAVNAIPANVYAATQTLLPL